MAIEVGPSHGEALSLVRDAVRHKNNARFRPQDKHEDYDEVWCVVDVEAPVPQESLHAAIHEASKAGVYLALTNPCFESWVLLHFEDHFSYASSAEAQRKLASLERCGYNVRAKRLECSTLVDYEDAAVGRARRLRGNTRGNPIKTNPWTNMDILVAVLNDPAMETVSGDPERCIPREFGARRS